MATIPLVRVRGGALERGRGYGEQARDRVRTSIASYEKVFSVYAGWDWPRVRREAERYLDPVSAYDERYVQEMRGIAEGASVEFLDVLAINVRTEVMFAAKARQAEAAWWRTDHQLPGECTAFGVATTGGHTLVGQNWDWLVHAVDTVVVVEAEQDEAPNYVNVVEAGLLAKTGMNSSGLGVVTNALATEDDRGEPGVPYHVILRALMDRESLSDAIAAVQRASRSSSANYLIAHSDGVAVDLEATPGDFSRIFLLPDEGVLVHTNHFQSTAFDRKDVSLWLMPDSAVRLGRFRGGIEGEDGTLSLGLFGRLLADHANYPSSVCSHADERLDPVDRGATIASILMDLDERRVLLADGHPCTVPYRELALGDLLHEPSSQPSVDGEPAARTDVDDVISTQEAQR